MNKKFLLTFFVILMISSFIAETFTYAREPRKKSGSTDKSVELMKETGLPRSTLININNMAGWLRADLWSSRDPRTGNSGVLFPRGLGPNAAVIFADGLIWAGLVDDGQTPVLRASGQTYNIGTLEGRIISPGVAEDANAADVRIWRIRRDFAAADLNLDAEELGLDVATVRAQYAMDWREWPWEKGAPWSGVGNLQDGGYLGADGETVMGAGNGILDRGEDANMNAVLDAGEDANGNGVLDGEVPGNVGADQVVWTVANDLSGSNFAFLGSPPIGLEIQQTVFGFARTDALGNMIFKQVKMIYKGTEFTPANAKVDSMFWTQWSDPDLGTYSDDFVGVDEDLSFMFVYNASSTDGTFNSFGLPPPAGGYDFFQGVLVPGVAGEDRNNNGVDDAVDTGLFNLKKTQPGFINLPMRSFGFFAAGSTISDPPLGERDGTLQWWNLLRGFIPLSDPANPTSFTTNDGTPTFFPLNGDPVTGTGDNDGVLLPPGDRRMLMTSGPFTLALGDTQEIVISLIMGLGSDRLSSVSVIKFFDKTAQATFDNLFQVVKPPPPPIVSASGLEGQIVLNWGTDPEAIAATEGQDESGFKFEGYNVYQLRTAAPDLSPGNAVRLATFDVVNEITTVLSEVFDVVSGTIVERPVQIGTNSGIKRFFTITSDAFRDKPLANDQDFFFAVTAYNATADLAQTTRALETPPSVITVRPQSPNPGFRITTTAGQILDVTHDGGSDGAVVPIVVDPAVMTGDDYEVTFRVNDEGETVWDLTNVSKGEIVLADQTNQSGDDNYLISDGFQAKVSGPALFGLGFTFEGPRWTSGSSAFGGEVFFGAGFLGPNFAGSNLPAADFRTISVDFFSKTGFTDLNGNGEYDIGEPYQLDADAGQMANSYSGFGGGNFLKGIQVPFRVFDIDADPPRQLTIVQRDRDQNGQWDLHKQYDPADADFVDVNGGDIRFNYVFILDSDYDATLSRWDATTPEEDFFAQVDVDGGPVQWVLWMQQRGSREPLEGDFHMTFIAPKVNTSADVFSFNAIGPSFTDAQRKKDALEMVGVFPNPYLGFNRLETNSISRFVRFNHLPEQATVRIFNLAGTFVRALDKNDPSPWLDWDLKNESNLPVASGLYIAHIEMPGVGQKILKLAIVQEQQFLDTF